jgi:erythromycin esterase-like protein
MEHQKLKITNNLFEWRTEEMAKNITDIISIDGKNNKALIILHNLHIKNKGSHEKGNLPLMSVKERIDARLRKKSISIAQVALCGNAVNNDLTPFDFLSMTHNQLNHSL